jgi:hypothetical protein
VITSLSRRFTGVVLRWDGDGGFDGSLLVMGQFCGHQNNPVTTATVPATDFHLGFGEKETLVPCESTSNFTREKTTAVGNESSPEIVLAFCLKRTSCFPSRALLRNIVRPPLLSYSYASGARKMADSSAVQNRELAQEQSQNGSVSAPIGKVKTQKECN